MEWPEKSSNLSFFLLLSHIKIARGSNSTEPPWQKTPLINFMKTNSILNQFIILGIGIDFKAD